FCSGHATARRPLSFPTRRSSDLSSTVLGLRLDGRQGSKTELSHPSPGRFQPTWMAFQRSSFRNLNKTQRWHELSGQLLAQQRWRSEEHTSELQSRSDLVCRLLLD